MVGAAESTRRFKVYARHLDHHNARLVEETSFEAAAIAYMEDFDLSASIGDAPELRVIVRDVGTGREHCFKLDLGTGQTTSCG
jgi:hypothetical protein